MLPDDKAAEYHTEEWLLAAQKRQMCETKPHTSTQVGVAAMTAHCVPDKCSGCVSPAETSDEGTLLDQTDRRS